MLIVAMGQSKSIQAIYPMHRIDYLKGAARCGAHSRRTGQPCRAPAIRDRKRCRMHGGKGSGAPLRNQNAVTSGDYTAKAQGQHLGLALLHYWLDGDRRRCRSRISRPMEAEALLRQLRALGMGGVADDIAAEFLP